MLVFIAEVEVTLEVQLPVRSNSRFLTSFLSVIDISSTKCLDKRIAIPTGEVYK